MATLGEELGRLRRHKGWTLREVEERTNRKVSNSYLNQLENDNVKEPSPNILYELARVYGASYSGLMKLAGFMVPRSSSKASDGPLWVAFNALDLSEEEKEQVMDFVEFLRRKKRSARG